MVLEGEGIGAVVEVEEVVEAEEEVEETSVEAVEVVEGGDIGVIGVVETLVADDQEDDQEEAEGHIPQDLMFEFSSEFPTCYFFFSHLLMYTGTPAMLPSLPTHKFLPSRILT